MIFRGQKSVNPFSSIVAGGYLYRFNSYRIPLPGTTRAADLDTFYREPVQKCPILKTYILAGANDFNGSNI